MSDGTLFDVLARASASAHGVRFLDHHERETFFSYGELHGRSCRAGRWLSEAGVRTGDHVAIVMATGVGFFDAFFGAMACGAVPVPLYPPVRLGRLDDYHERTAAMLAACDAKILVTERRVHRVLGRTVERFQPEYGVASIESLIMTATEPSKPVPLNPDDVAFIQFSSGTTARPKPIRLTHRQVLANVAAITDQILTAYPEVDGRVHGGCSWLPLYHDMGLVGCVFVAMARPRDLTLIPPESFLARPAIWLRALSASRATISPAPNFAYSLCVDRVRADELDGVDLSNWLIALNGAEPVTPSALERFVERFSEYGLPRTSLTPVYGLGEATLAVTFSALDAPWRWRRFDREALVLKGEAVSVRDGGMELVSLGPPLPGFDVCIRDENHDALDEGRLGRVWISGPSIMSGYHRMELENEQVFDADWLDTGDRGFLFGGELYLFGREKDTIVLHGRNYAAQDIERALDGLNGIRAGCCAAVGVLGDAGEALHLLVETPLDDEPARRVLVQQIREAVLERCALPATVVLLERGALPRTSSGKISRVRARELFSADALTPPKRVTALGLTGELVRSFLAHRRARSER
ncbi:MAG: fatty acyl-AMP ligase [Myxococcota bacterium]